MRPRRRQHLKLLGREVPLRPHYQQPGRPVPKRLVPDAPQRKRLERAVDVLVATPGRLIKLMEAGALFLGDVRHVVLDEVDTMFDAGFGPAYFFSGCDASGTSYYGEGCQAPGAFSFATGLPVTTVGTFENKCNIQLISLNLGAI